MESWSFYYNQKKRWKKWQMNRRYTIGESVESIDRVVYHKNNSSRQTPEQTKEQTGQYLKPIVSNGGVAKKTSRSDSMTSDSDLAAVTINFTTSTKESAVNDTSVQLSTTIDVSPQPSTNNDISPIEETVAEKTLPWQDNTDPSPTHLADSVPNNEPVIAHVPTWVNNLSYSHITETGSPYVSPQTTLIPRPSDYHKTVYSIFPPNEDKDDEDETSKQNGVNSSDYFPTPWGNLEDCPQVSPMVIETGARSDDLLHSTHTQQAPDHHHVIVPTIELINSSNSSEKNVAHLTAVASAPDFQHWKPLQKGLISEMERHNESDTMLSELAFVEGVKSRVQQWLKEANDDEENDADEEDADTLDNLDSAEDLERELDLVMNTKR